MPHELGPATIPSPPPAKEVNIVPARPGQYTYPGTVWVPWNGQTGYTDTGTGSSAISSATIWSGWNSNTITSSSSSITLSGATWTNWNSNSVTVTQYPMQAETDEQRRLREEQTRRWQEERAAVEREVRKAKLRAKKLLVDHLNPQQREDYEKRGFFHLYTNKGRKYRIHQGTHGNVRLVDVTTDEELGRYCSQPSGVPDEDAMLAQKLYLEIDEDEFIAHANFTKTKYTALLDARGRPIEQERVAA